MESRTTDIIKIFKFYRTFAMNFEDRAIMNKILTSVVLFLLLHPENLSAQYLFGQVTDAQGTALPGALVAWAGTTIGARTDEKGEFAIPLPQDTVQKPLRLAAIFSAARDTFLIGDLSRLLDRTNDRHGYHAGSHRTRRSNRGVHFGVATG
ncbi:MAG: carboxypeptidase-like regulatory domain-containing protein [Saprospirales bacterium]|nr:carboxypeptidase-like regulatory domain-containing protein [Saprospirales bacterium]